MRTYEELEREYMAFCETVRRDALAIAGKCLANRTDAAGEAATRLAQSALTRQNQYRMQQEQQGDYDLSALRVDAATPSNSETVWERDDG